MHAIALSLIFTAGAVACVAYLLWPQIALWRELVKEPACGRCRYAVRGNTTLRCSECGADLRIHGIVTPGMAMRRPRTLATGLVAWTFLWAILGYAVTLAAARLPGRITADKNTTFTSVDPADAGVTLQANLTSTGWVEPPASQVFTFTLKHSGDASKDGAVRFPWPGATVESSSGSAAPALKPGTSVGPEALQAWLRAAGVAQPTALGAELSDIIRELAGQPYNVAMALSRPEAWLGGGMSNSVGLETPWWFQPALGGAWCLVWPIGGLLVARWRAKPADPSPTR